MLETNVTTLRFGVGAAIPKDIQDGTFTRRIPASDDKLLQQLLGKKAAKAHIARQSIKSNTKPNVESKPQRRVIKEESEEEEEGRSSAFKSKRRKVAKEQPVHPPVDGDHDDRRDNADADGTELQQETEAARGETRKNASEGEDSEEDSKKSTTKSRAVKPKARSYLDELLAERSNKKQRKKQSRAGA